MKQLVFIILVGAVAYLLYDKFKDTEPFVREDVDSPNRYAQREDTRNRPISPTSDSPVRVSPRSGNVPSDVKNISLWKLDHPESMTEEEVKLAERWQEDKPRYMAEITRMKSVLTEKTKSPYRYDRRYAEKLSAAIRDFGDAVNYDDFIVVPQRHNKAKDELMRFENTCEWQSGISKGYGTHMRSGNAEGSWVPDPGYVMVRRGGELVAMRELRCNGCRGTGYKIQRINCPTCNGRGRVPNPMAQVGNAVNMIGAITGGRRGRNHPRMPRQPSEINCSSCNRGRIEQRIVCPDCGGRCKIYR